MPEHRPIRVLQVTGGMDCGGTETWLLNVLRHSKKTAYQFDFCVFRPEPQFYEKEITARGGRVIVCSRQRGLGRFVSEFWRLLTCGDYDAVHCHLHWFNSVILCLASCARVPVRICHSHNISDGARPTVPRRLYRVLAATVIRKKLTRALACSRPAAVALFGPEWASDPRVEILYCGVDVGSFSRPELRLPAREELGIPGDARVIGHVGRFVEAKNHHHLLRIVSELSGLFPNVYLLAVGEGPLRASIEAKARDLGLAHRCRFTGRRSDLPALYAAMDVFCLPSKWEGLPLVLMEAQAAGLPVVASDLPGVREVLAPGEHSVLLDLRDDAEAIRAIYRWFAAPTLPRWAPTRFLERFDIGRSVGRLHQIYSGA